MREQYTTSLDPWTLKQARRVAKAQGTTVAALIDQGLLLVVARHDEQKMSASTVPPLPGDRDAELLREADNRRRGRGAA
jgi:hypothetical protein